MKKKNVFLNNLLVLYVGVILIGILLLHAFFPAVFIPEPNIPDLVLLSMVVLLTELFLKKSKIERISKERMKAERIKAERIKKEEKRCYGQIFILGAITFGLLPWCAGFLPANQIFSCAIKGAAVFTISTGLFTAMQERMHTGESGTWTSIIQAFILYLASQGMMGF